MNLQITISHNAYMSEHFEAVVNAHRDQMPADFAFIVTRGPVVHTTERDEALARQIIAALEAA